MAKIISLLRNNGGMANVPALLVVGNPISEGGAVIEKILHRKYETEGFQGQHYEVNFKDSPVKIYIPGTAVLEVMCEAAPKKEKVEVPPLA